MAEKKSILLRLSPKMWEEISKWAEDEFRSVNGQIEYLISDALRKRNKSSQTGETDENYSAVSSESTKPESSEE